MKKYLFGPSVARVAPARPSHLVGVSIEGVDNVDGVELVKLKLDPPQPIRPLAPKRVFAVYFVGAPDTTGDAMAFLSGEGKYTGVVEVPDRDPETGEAVFAIPVENVPGDDVTEFTVQTVLEYDFPDAP